MNKEEILELSRQENREQDLYELEVTKKANGVGSIVSVIVCTILYAAEIMLCGNQNFGLWSIIAAFLSSTFLYSGIKTKKNSKTAVGALWAVIFVISIVTAIVDLFTTSTIL